MLTLAIIGDRLFLPGRFALLAVAGFERMLGRRSGCGCGCGCSETFDVERLHCR